MTLPADKHRLFIDEQASFDMAIGALQEVGKMRDAIRRAVDCGFRMFLPEPVKYGGISVHQVGEARG